MDGDTTLRLPQLHSRASPLYLRGDSALDEVDGGFHHDTPLLRLADGCLPNMAAAAGGRDKGGGAGGGHARDISIVAKTRGVLLCSWASTSRL